MKIKELGEYLEEMYACGPEAESVEGLVQLLDEAGLTVTTRQVARACFRLCNKGILRRADKGNYTEFVKWRFEADPSWIAERGL